ncbi:hypothetical protein [Maricaulis sp.]|uniref:hypothetical protein n=1 Tax=Maricaulis sp. TaxID=1486257 RepID=UPI003A8EE946
MRYAISAWVAGGLFLAACSDSPDAPVAEAAPAATTGESQFPAATTGESQFPADGPVEARVEYYVTRLGPQLPMPINASVVMDRVSRNRLEIELHYTVHDSTITSQQVESFADQTAPGQTCNNAMTAGMVRDGAAFRYSYDGAGLQRPVSVVIDHC